MLSESIPFESSLKPGVNTAWAARDEASRKIMTSKSHWILEGQPSRTADGAHTVGVFGNQKNCRVEVSIELGRLSEFGKVKESLEARKELVRLALRVVLEEFAAKSPKAIKPGALTRISDMDVNMREIQGSVSSELKRLGLAK
jgi:hypothetical protein